MIRNVSVEGPSFTEKATDFLFDPNMSDVAASAIGPEFEISYRNGRLFAVVNESVTEEDPFGAFSHAHNTHIDKAGEKELRSSLPAFGVLAAMAATAILILVLAVIIGKLKRKYPSSSDEAEGSDGQKTEQTKGTTVSNMNSATTDTINNKNPDDEAKVTSHFPTGMPSFLDRVNKKFFPRRSGQQNSVNSISSIPPEHLREIVVF
ncbi:unnamed protein product [Notodromas monacha]|uniref:Uncharacterized protein n=1 Tax=Notodromas monacha TaxID=399045 RepID=A0A7R9GB46_9CRUS|nr:unnamed protein product [Notodromas monacha]CAG0915946.1 unnamed protein product [Notodromas monacha]